MEKDDEIAPGVYTADFWEYDSRLGRRWNLDPVTKPFESPYSTFHGNPIYYADPTGLDGEGSGGKLHKVAKGDTYWALAKKSGGKYSVADLEKWNPGVDHNNLKVGSYIITSDPSAQQQAAPTLSSTISSSGPKQAFVPPVGFPGIGTKLPPTATPTIPTPTTPPSTPLVNPALGFFLRTASLTIGLVLMPSPVGTDDIPKREDYPKIHFVYEEYTPEIYQHTVNSIATGSPARLTYGGPGQGNINRPNALKPFKALRGPGQSRDEYPYASTVEGGFGAKVALVPVNEQNIQAMQLRALYSIMKPGDRFIVVPVPKTSTLTDPKLEGKK